MGQGSPYLSRSLPDRANSSIRALRSRAAGVMPQLARAVPAGKEASCSSADRAAREVSLRVLSEHPLPEVPLGRPSGAGLLRNLKKLCGGGRSVHIAFFAEKPKFSYSPAARRSRPLRCSTNCTARHWLQTSADGEIQSSCGVDPMKLPWASTVRNTDSGPKRGAAISTEATVPEVRAEARYAESRGWSVAQHVVYYFEARHGGEDRLFQRDAAIFMHFFSRTRRAGDLSQGRVQEGHAASVPAGPVEGESPRAAAPGASHDSAVQGRTRAPGEELATASGAPSISQVPGGGGTSYRLGPLVEAQPRAAPGRRGKTEPGQARSGPCDASLAHAGSPAEGQPQRGLAGTGRHLCGRPS